MVFGETGSLPNITLKYHYDNYKRVAEETYDYYYTHLNKTPFSIAIAIPSGYGHYSLDVGDEIQTNRHTGENLTSFFIGKWKVHPKWIYCRYHYLEGHEFNTSEAEFLHFVGKIYEPDFKWEPQYATMEEEDISAVECGRKTLDDNDYYCDKDLVQQLIFDARNTYEPFKENWKFQSDYERMLFTKYNVTLRFVATMSGLTRWDYIFDNYTNSKAKPKKEFGDLNPRAIDEKWYKSAVIQHQYDTESFVYSVPFKKQDTSQNTTPTDVLVTASYAIFVKESGIEAPGCVVGFQFSQAKFKTIVEEVSTNISHECSHCQKCDGENLICYVVDSSGYILVSADDSSTGEFFGKIEGDIFDTMVKENVFVKKTLFDYQAMCEHPDPENTTSTSNVIYTPLYYATAAIQWIITKIFYTLMEMNVYQLFDTVVTLAEDNVTSGDITSHSGNSNSTSDKSQQVDNNKNKSSTKPKLPPYACEEKITLFYLQQSLFIEDNFHGELSTAAKRKFYTKRIPHSNLIFVAAQSWSTRNNETWYTTDPHNISSAPSYTKEGMNSLLSCKKLYLNNLIRKGLTECYNIHPEEEEIHACGKSTMITYNAFFLIGVLFHSVFILKCKFL